MPTVESGNKESAVGRRGDLNDVSGGAARGSLGTTLPLTSCRIVRCGAQFLGTGAVYFVCAKYGLLLASINPSATPIWPATGVALAAVLLLGYRILPAIFLAAFL